MTKIFQCVVCVGVLALCYFGALVFTNRVAAERANNVASSTSEYPPVREGEPLRVDGAHFERSPATVVLVTSPECSHCIANSAFHRRLAQELASKRIPFLVALPYGGSSSFIGLGHNEHTDIRWAAIHGHLQGTPTLILVRRSGVVEKVWAGELNGPKATAAESAITGLTVDDVR